eukprot:CAMPEP_0180732338 /NCGR_PEP_ID=MMETSP1038_2-20121128/21613_1 /TAXON_ID=632150 /ORGANISM="Azadinium spinosum, Strain 3D9" /LENGTH=55 /DNA_ID=CAMNT_0022765185 /DNA_START=318 /DNA_END=485 /DNA_ORIENTATION=+
MADLLSLLLIDPSVFERVFRKHRCDKVEDSKDHEDDRKDVAENEETATRKFKKPE